MNLLPMLLIERQISTPTSSLVLSIAKGAQFLGFFISGYCTQYLGSRNAILISYALTGIGFLILPYAPVVTIIAASAVLAQMGMSISNVSVRNLLRENTAGTSLKEGLAWLRTANNMGQVVTSLVGIGIGSLGLILPFLFDSITSFLALILGLFFLPKSANQETENPDSSPIQKGFYNYSVALAVYFFVYELAFLSFSAFAKIRNGAQGVTVFSIILLINTLICGALAVPAAKRVKNPRISMPIAVLLTLLGPILFLKFGTNYYMMAFAALVFSLGEVLFAVHSQTLLLINSSAQRGAKHYGRSLMIQSLGRIAAGAALFPLVIEAKLNLAPFILASVIFFLFFLKLPKSFLHKNI